MAETAEDVPRGEAAEDVPWEEANEDVNLWESPAALKLHQAISGRPGEADPEAWSDATCGRVRTALRGGAGLRARDELTETLRSEGWERARSAAAGIDCRALADRLTELERKTANLVLETDHLSELRSADDEFNTKEMADARERLCGLEKRVELCEQQTAAAACRSENRQRKAK